MARVDVLHHAFNIGVFDRDKLHRVDLERMRLAAERQTNLQCDSSGQAQFRAGTQYLATLPSATRPVEFIASNDEASLLLLSNNQLRVLDGKTDALVTRPAVTSTVPSGDFSAGTGWTLSTAAGQSSVISGGKLTLKARAHGAKARASATITVAGGNIGKVHALRIVVDRGPVMFRLGTSAGADDLIRASVLRTGEHSLAFTPAGDVYIEFSTEHPVDRIVDSCMIEAAGIMVLPTRWPVAALNEVRTAQSLDVMFVACEGYKWARIERRGDLSWSVVDYDTEDGPFRAGRSADIKLAPGALEGNTTLTASDKFFTPAHVGSMFRLFHEKQRVDTYLAAAGAETPAFLVTGITETNFEERKFTVTISGTWAGTLRHRRSYGGEFGDYVDFRRAQASADIDITANATYTNDDNDDNIDIWVKMVFAAYTSGEARVQFDYGGGGGYGICRVTGYTSPTEVSVEVLVPFKDTASVENWRQSRFDGVSGWPAAVGFVDGRLLWTGNDLFDASVSDAYESFNEEFDGEAGPISRSIALGGRNDVRWVLPLSSLMLGCDSRIANLRASSLDEILTPDNAGMKSSGRIGAAPISPVELADDRAVFVQASGISLYEITWSAEKARYISSPFSKLTTDLFKSGIIGLAVQTLPDQRIWVANNDGDAVCIVFEPASQVLAAHVPISTSHALDRFRQFAVLPADDQDRVYTIARRRVGGNDVYMLEKFAADAEAKVGTVCKVMDSHLAGTGAHAATIAGLDHLEGREVVAWVDGAPVTDPAITDPALDNAMIFTVTGGEITLPEAPTAGWCVGLRYGWEYKSARLAYGVEGYTPMLKKKSLAAAGIMLGDYCRSGVRYGTTRGKGFATPWSLPLLSSDTGEAGEEVVAGPGEDEIPVVVDSEIGLDSRLCIAGQSPKPVTLRALVLAIETHG